MDNPIVSDVEYDRVYDELVLLEKKLGIVLENSPTTRVGDVVLEGFAKHTHKVRLYSLDKVNKMQDLKKWVEDVKKHYPHATFDLEYKFDGLNICCCYKGESDGR